MSATPTPIDATSKHVLSTPPAGTPVTFCSSYSSDASAYNDEKDVIGRMCFFPNRRGESFFIDDDSWCSGDGAADEDDNDDIWYDTTDENDAMLAPSVD